MWVIWSSDGIRPPKDLFTDITGVGIAVYISNQLHFRLFGTVLPKVQQQQHSANTKCDSTYVALHSEILSPPNFNAI